VSSVNTPEGSGASSEAVSFSGRPAAVGGDGNEEPLSSCGPGKAKEVKECARKMSK
jgi:hypothetical protein